MYHTQYTQYPQIDSCRLKHIKHVDMAGGLPNGAFHKRRHQFFSIFVSLPLYHQTSIFKKKKASKIDFYFWPLFLKKKITPNFMFYWNSQNAGLRPAMLAIAVSVRWGNFGKFVLSRFHIRFSVQLTQPGQYSRRFRRWHLTAKTRVLCYKTFSVRKSRISARIPDFSGILLVC